MEETETRNVTTPEPTRFPGLWLAVLAAGFSAALAVTEPVRVVAGLLYDAVVRSVAVTEGDVHELLLVRAELRAQAFDDAYWLSLLQALLQGQPARVAFMHMPEAVSTEFYVAAAESKRVVFGRSRVFEENDLGYVGLAHPPETAVGQDLSFGIVEAPPTRLGVYRSYITNFPLEGRGLPAFALAAAFGDQDADKRRRYGRAGEIFLNFVTAGLPLPAVSADRILAGDWDPEFIRGRTIIVGYVDDIYLPLMRAPLGSDIDRLSVLEAQGYAALTVLRNAPVRMLPQWAVILLLLVVCGINAYLYRPLSMRAGALWTAAALVAYAVLAGVVLRVSLVWLPLMELIMAQGALWGLLLYKRAQIRYQRLGQIADRVDERVAQAPSPVQSVQSADPWDARVQLLNQSLELTRLIFLELSADGKRLKEVKAFQCGFDDIEERRRDPSRSPYSSVLTKVVAPLDTAYFKTSLPEERVYLVPLRHDEQLLGFWVFGILAERAAAMPLFSVCVQDYAAQVADLIVSERRAQQESQRSWISRALAIEADDSHELRLALTHRRLGSRLHMLEDLVQGLDTATAVYDLFGRPLVVNAAMAQLGERVGIDAARMDGLAFAAAVGRVSEGEARRWLRNVVVHRASFSTLAGLGPDEGLFALLRLRPLLQRQDAALGEAESSPFSMRGILFEIVDATALRRLYDLKDQVLRQASATLPEEVQKVLRAAATLENPKLPESHRSHLAKLTMQKVANTVQQLAQADRLLHMNPLESGPACYPVDPLPGLHGAIAEIQPLAAQAGVQVRVDLGPESRMVFAEEPALQRVLAAILKALIVAAPSGSGVQIFSKSDPVQVAKEHRLTFWFVNETRGVYEGQLQRWFKGEETQGEAFEPLRGAMQAVETWGGTLECTSVAEAGITFRLRLRGFL